jgi:hypothetical protein
VFFIISEPVLAKVNKNSSSTSKIYFAIPKQISQRLAQRNAIMLNESYVKMRALGNKRLA